MADAVAARREARRKRILENSHNRLQLISGKCDDDCPRESPIRSVIPEQIREISVTPENVCILNRSLINNGVVLPETIDTFLVNHDNAIHDVAAGDGEVPDDLAPFTSTSLTQEPTPTSCLWEKVTNYRYDIVLLSLIMQLLYGLTLVTFEDTYFFLPILIYVITKMIWFPAQSSTLTEQYLTIAG
ncbi:unnamed protein product [Arctia plantaginis]|uniref:Uncharacterized protein n=1 Tax=Arctia plantaginis TaxID=874455 RepID=A0A8S1AQC7_ARCPL|nr:unnamed protein product [Arctia plantaginis]